MLIIEWNQESLLSLIYLSYAGNRAQCLDFSHPLWKNYSTLELRVLSTAYRGFLA